MPKKVKYRKWQTGRMNMNRSRVATRGTELSFGEYGIKATTMARIRSNQIESARKVLSRPLKKIGKMWIRIFPDRPYTAKPGGLGMGKGKGDLQGYCVEVYPGRVLFELEGIPESEAREVLRKAGAKLPVKTRFVKRDEV